MAVNLAAGIDEVAVKITLREDNGSILGRLLLLRTFLVLNVALVIDVVLIILHLLFLGRCHCVGNCSELRVQELVANVDLPSAVGFDRVRVKSKNTKCQRIYQSFVLHPMSIDGQGILALGGAGARVHGLLDVCELQARVVERVLCGTLALEAEDVVVWRPVHGADGVPRAI